MYVIVSVMVLLVPNTDMYARKLCIIYNYNIIVDSVHVEMEYIRMHIF